MGVPPGKNNDVSGLSNLARNIGGSAGTSFFTTMLARHQQVHQQYLAQHVYGGGQAYLQKAGSLSQLFLTRTASLADANSKAMLSLYQSVQVQASVLSYIDILQSLCILCACMVPLVFLMKRPPKGTKAAVH